MHPGSSTGRGRRTGWMVLLVSRTRASARPALLLAGTPRGAVFCSLGTFPGVALVPVLFGARGSMSTCPCLLHLLSSRCLRLTQCVQPKLTVSTGLLSGCQGLRAASGLPSSLLLPRPLCSVRRSPGIVESVTGPLGKVARLCLWMWCEPPHRSFPTGFPKSPL